MACGQNEAVTVEPTGVCLVVVKEAAPENVGHGSGTHRHSRMTAVGLLHGINREKADRVNAEVINA